MSHYRLCLRVKNVRFVVEARQTMVSLFSRLQTIKRCVFKFGVSYIYNFVRIFQEQLYIPNSSWNHFKYCCEIHWDENDIIGGPTRKRLKSGAVPMIQVIEQVALLLTLSSRLHGVVYVCVYVCLFVCFCFSF